MEIKNVLEAHEIPKVAMDAMNGVHEDELNIVNNVNAAIHNDDLEQLTILCHEWMEHTKAHFDRENYLMEKYDFPAFHCHHREHVEAISGLETIINGWLEDKNIDELATYVRETWPAWYVNHISTMDTVTSAFIKQSISNE